jgi:hypothetical protein
MQVRRQEKQKMKSAQWIPTAAVLAALTGCGADDISSPGNSGNVTINNTIPRR